MSDSHVVDDAVKSTVRLLEQSKLEDAVALARRALDDGIEAPLLLNLRAYWLEGQDRPKEALADLERARTLAPDDTAVLNALGLCCARLGQMEQALEAFQRCAALAPDFAPAHFNCGWALEELGALDRAREAFETSTRLNPSSADAWARLASLAVRRGQWDAARELAEKALALNAKHPQALIALANVDLAERALSRAERRLQGLIATEGPVRRDRAIALGLLGDVYDVQGRYREAFNAYAEGNRELEESFAQYLAIHSELRMGEYVGWLLAAFAGPADAAWHAGPPPPPDPEGPAAHVFVLGFPRSGTTLLEEVLACHPDAVTTGEKDALAEIVREIFADPRRLERLKHLDRDGVRRFRRQYYEALTGFGIPAKERLLVDKQPFNSVRWPLIAKLFPDAKIVFCLRDPRDVVLSCFRRRLALNGANAEFVTLDGAARLYDAVMRLVEIYKNTFSIPWVETRNEDLVEHFEAEMRKLCAFLNFTWVEEFRDFAARSRAREVATPSAAQIQQGLDRRSIDRWRLYEADMAPVLPILNPWARRFGYEPD